MVVTHVRAMQKKEKTAEIRMLPISPVARNATLPAGRKSAALGMNQSQGMASTWEKLHVLSMKELWNTLRMQQISTPSHI